MFLSVSIQISINWGKKYLRISCIRKIAVILILARVFAYLPSFFSQILGLTGKKIGGKAGSENAIVDSRINCCDFSEKFGTIRRGHLELPKVQL